MCTFPSYLKNPSKHFDVLKDKIRVTCNCGHCIECMDKKRSEWQTRLYFDWLGAKAHGGNSYIATLTYDDVHLPLKWLFYNGKYVAFPCFESSDFNRMTKDIRRAVPDFMYFGQEEYGDCGRAYITDSGKLAYTTHRPHYHLYCSCTSLSVTELKKLVEDNWPYGNVYWSKRKDSLLPEGRRDKANCRDLSELISLHTYLLQ